MQRKDFRCTLIVSVNEGNVCFHFEGANDFQSHIDDLIKYCIRQLYLFLPLSLDLSLSLCFLFLFSLSSSASTPLPSAILSLSFFYPIPLLFIQFSSHSIALIHHTLPPSTSFFSIRVCKNCYEKNPIHTLRM